MSDGELWQMLASELIRREMHNDAAGNRPQHHIKYVTVVVTGRGNAEQQQQALTLSGLGGGNLCLIRTCNVGLASWPITLDMVGGALVADGRRRRVDISGGNGGIGGCHAGGRRDDVGYASAIGALCHELGHTFGLGHTRHGLMGDGFDYVARVFCVDLTTVWAPERLVSATMTTTATQTRIMTTPTVRKPSAGMRLMQRFREQQNDADDRTWFEDISIAILEASLWMRLASESFEDNDANDISVDWTNRMVTATTMLRLVELRRAPDALMLMWWRFDGCGRREFRIPAPDTVRSMPGTDNGAADGWCWANVAQIFVMNASGGAKLFDRPEAVK